MSFPAKIADEVLANCARHCSICHRFCGTKMELHEDLRLRLEISLLRRKIDHEVVILQADDEGAIRRTHRRYFEELAELVER